MKTKHTPGPWIVESVAATLTPSHKDFLVTHSDDELRSHICRIFDASLCDEHGDTEANARLIASAPELLDALQRLTHPAADDSDVEYALEIIAKATGE